MFLAVTAHGGNHAMLSWLCQKHPEKLFERDNFLAWFETGESASTVYLTAEFPDYYLWDTDAPCVDGYVTDRCYAATSLFASLIRQNFRSAAFAAYTNKGPAGEDLAEIRFDKLTFALLPIVTNLDVLDIERFFNATGITIETTQAPKPNWLRGKKQVLRIYGTYATAVSLSDLLRILLVFIPYADNYLHFKPSEDHVALLEKCGAGWLADHPDHTRIRARLLGYKKGLIETYDEAQPVTEEDEEKDQEPDDSLTLAECRRAWFLQEINLRPHRSVVDAGCGSGRLAQEVIEKIAPPEVIACDVSTRALRMARRYCKTASVFFTSLTYPDKRLRDKDVFCLQEVIEHFEPPALQQLASVLFGVYKPKTVLMTTPNRAVNDAIGVPEGELRHPDHKFEWDEEQAKDWAEAVAGRYGYDVTTSAVGVGVPEYDPELIEIGQVMFGSIGIAFERKDL